MMNSYNESVQQINSQTCRVPQKPEVGKKVNNDKLSKYEKRYFKFDLPESGITVKIEVNKGKTRGYYSYTIENPSSAVNDGEFTNEVFIPYQKKYVLGRAKRTTDETMEVYVTIEGNEDHNEYSLDSLEDNHTNASDPIAINIFFIIISLKISIVTF